MASEFGDGKQPQKKVNVGPFANPVDPSNPFAGGPYTPEQAQEMFDNARTLSAKPDPYIVPEPGNPLIQFTPRPAAETGAIAIPKREARRSHKARNRILAGVVGLATGLGLIKIGQPVISNLESNSSTNQAQGESATATVSTLKDIPLTVDGVAIPEKIRAHLKDYITNPPKLDALDPNSLIKISSPNDNGSNDIETKGVLVDGMLAQDSQGNKDAFFFIAHQHGSQVYIVVDKADASKFIAGVGVFTDKQAQKDYTCLNGCYGIAQTFVNPVDIYNHMYDNSPRNPTATQGGSSISGAPVEVVQGGEIRQGDVVYTEETIGRTTSNTALNEFVIALQQGQDITQIVNSTHLAVMWVDNNGNLTWVDTTGQNEQPVDATGLVSISGGAFDPSMPAGAIGRVGSTGIK